MKRTVSVLTVTILIAAGAAIAFAQMQQPVPSRPGVAPPGSAPAEKMAREVEGTVKKVDPAAKTVDVSAGLLGMMGTKLEVTDDTKIQVDGKDATLADIREGTKVKASYESQQGKNVAKSIEVKPEEKKEPAASPSTRPAPSTPSTPGPKY